MDDEEEEITVYDAVAGRVFHGGAVSDAQPADDDLKANTLEAVPPDEVLARQSDAPARNEENDIYSADRHLDPTDPVRIPWVQYPMRSAEKRHNSCNSLSWLEIHSYRADW